MKGWFAFLFLAVLGQAADQGYRVQESGNGKNFELVTPTGNRMLLGDFAPDGVFNFRMEIPRELLEPKKTTAEGEEAQRSLSGIAPTSTNTTIVMPERHFGGADGEGEGGKKKEDVPPRVIVEHDDSDRYVVEANRLFNRGKFYESHQVLEEVLRKKPNLVRAWVMKGSVLFVMKQKELAKKAWAQALELEPNNSELKDIVKRYK